MVDINTWNDSDRNQSILTKKEREYLLERRELGSQDKRNTRYRIRNRLINALLDIQILENSNIPNTVLADLEQVANHQRIDLELRVSLVRLVYDLILLDDRVSETDEEFELTVERAFMRSKPYEEDKQDEAFLGRSFHVKIEAEDEYIDFQEVKRNMETGEVSVMELAGVIDKYEDEESGFEDEELYKEAKNRLDEQLG